MPERSAIVTGGTRGIGRAIADALAQDGYSLTITGRRPDGVETLPGLAPVAMQQGRYAARAVLARIAGSQPRPFHYRDKGNLATIGRARAVADIKGVHLSGPIAWVTWLAVHLFYLIGFQNRVLVLTRWAFSFVAHGRGSRLISDERGASPQPSED